MARGHPDWGIDVDSASLFGIDNAELAARLGSLDVVTRGGKVIYQDDFNRPALTWLLGGSNSSCYSWLSVYRSFIGSQHLRLTTDLVATNWAYASRYFPYYPSLYSSVSFLLTVYDYPDPIEFGVAVQTGTRRWNFNIRINPTPYEIQYQNSGGTYTTIQNLYSLRSGASAIWHYIRLMYDCINGEYISLTINDTEIDLSGITPFNTAGGSDQYQNFIITVYGDGAQKGIAGIDSMICKVEDYIMYQ